MAEERAAELVGLEDANTPIPDDEFAGFDENTAAQLKRQILTAPLKGPGGIAGTLRVSMNWGETFSESDHQLLEMFANHALGRAAQLEADRGASSRGRPA